MSVFEKTETIVRVTRVPDAARGRVIISEGEARIVLEYETGNEERVLILTSEEAKALAPILDGLRKRALTELGFEAKEALTIEAQVLKVKK